MVNPTLSITHTPSWKTEGTHILDEQGRVVLFANLTNLSKEEQQQAVQLAVAAPRMLAALKALTAGMSRDDVEGMFTGHWLDALDALDAAEGRPIQPRRKSTVSLIPQPCETDWEKRLWYCYCGHPRSIDEHLEVEKCPQCGDDEFDLAVEVGP